MADNRNEPHYLFFLPNEDYIGLSYKLKRTLITYRKKGLNISGCRIINIFHNKEQALQAKAELNKIGFKGAAAKGRKI